MLEQPDVHYSAFLFAVCSYWHTVCLTEGQGAQTMTVKAICLTHKMPISIGGIVLMAPSCNILVIEDPKQEDK